MYLEFIKCKYKKIVWQILFWKWKLKLEWLDYSFAMYIFSKPPSKIEASQWLFLYASQGRQFSIFRDLAGRKFVILNCTVCTLSRVQLSVTPWTAAHQARLSMARLLEWVAISFSKGSSRPRDRIHVSCISCIGRWILYHWATKEAHLYICRSKENMKLRTH